MISIHLEKMEFFAYHGLYPEEQCNGNRFELDVHLDADLIESVQQLEDTIDYVKVYGLIQQRMKVATPLLETLAQDLAAQIATLDQRIKGVSVSIKKMTPPIPDFNGTVAVTCKKQFV